MENLNEAMIEEIVRKLITEKLGDVSKQAAPEMSRDIEPKSGIMSIKTETVKPEKFDTGHAGDQVFLKDVVSVEESPRLGCGIMEMKETSFEWTLMYDEIDYIIEGTLEVDINGKKVVGNKGDIIYIPKASTIHFTVPNYSKFMYVTYPADWADQAK